MPRAQLAEPVRCPVCDGAQIIPYDDNKLIGAKGAHEFESWNNEVEAVLRGLRHSIDLTKKTEACPRCRSSNVISILYGMPTSEAGEESDKGLIKLGGCDVSDDDPQWHCKDCRHEF